MCRRWHSSSRCWLWSRHWPSSAPRRTDCPVPAARSRSASWPVSSFGVVAIAARSLGELSPARLVREPAAYAVVAAGVVAFLYYTIGLQRAAVTTVTAALVIGETVLPSVVGVLVFGDGTRPGFLPVALAGFVLAVGCSLALARFGEVGSERAART